MRPLTARSPWTLLGIVAAALALRLPGHLDSGLWFDEIWLVIESIRVPFHTLYTTFRSDNNHPLYSLAAWTSVRAFGESAWALRLPALLFGVASVGMLWRLSLEVTSVKQAALVTALLAISSHHIWFSQNARGYTMLLFWTLAATHFLLQTYRGVGRWAWLFYAICLALATYTHRVALFVAMGHALLFVVAISLPGTRTVRFRADTWKPAAGLLLAGLLSLLLHAPILREMLSYQPMTTSFPEWESLWWTFRTVILSLGIGFLPGLVAAALGTTVMVVGGVSFLREDWKVALLFILPAIIGLALAILSGRPVRPRIFFNLGGFILLLAVRGTFVLSRALGDALPTGRRLGARLENAAAAAMVAASLAILPGAYLLPKQDFEGALEWARSPAADDGLVAVTVGPIAAVYRRYYEVDFPVIQSVEELDRAVETAGTVYLLHTLPIYLQSVAPELAGRLRAAEVVGRFRGSLQGGDVLVLRVGPRSG